MGNEAEAPPPLEDLPLLETLSPSLDASSKFPPPSISAPEDTFKEGGKEESQGGNDESPADSRSASIAEKVGHAGHIIVLFC